jgi:hypothetical protein
LKNAAETGSGHRSRTFDFGGFQGFFQGYKLMAILVQLSIVENVPPGDLITPRPPLEAVDRPLPFGRAGHPISNASTQ